MVPSVYLALQAVLICAQPGCAPGGTQESHVDANIVARTEFDRILRRDLEAYFAATTAQPIATLDYQLLRDGPTQSGLAYPKYYIWVVVQTKGDKRQEGAVRLQAIGRERFEVTDFLSKEEIRSNPSGLRSVFPEPVCVRIEEMMRR